MIFNIYIYIYNIFCFNLLIGNTIEKLNENIFNETLCSYACRLLLLSREVHLHLHQTNIKANDRNTQRIINSV
jgi:hypothetical protein